MKKEYRECLGYWHRFCGWEIYVYVLLLLLSVIIAAPSSTILGIYWFCRGPVSSFIGNDRNSGMRFVLSLPFSRKVLWNTYAGIVMVGLGIPLIALCLRKMEDPISILMFVFMLLGAHVICAFMPFYPFLFFAVGLPGIFIEIVYAIFLFQESTGFFSWLAAANLVLLLLDIGLWWRGKRKFCKIHCD